MSKATLVEAMVKDTGMTKAQAGAAFDSMVGTIHKAVKSPKSDNKITVPGIGTFSKSRTSARTGRNPKTGETLKIKAQNTVKCKVSSTFKDVVRPPKK